MNLPVFTWSCIAAVVIILLVVQVMRRSGTAPAKRHFRLFGLGSEREEIFVPGDLLRPSDKDYDCDDDF